MAVEKVKTIFSNKRRKSNTLKRLERTINKVGNKLAKAKREKERRKNHNGNQRIGNSRYNQIRKEDTF